MAIDLTEVYAAIRKIAAKFDPEAFQHDKEEEDQCKRTHLKRSGVAVYCVSLDTPDGGCAGRITLQPPYLAGENIYYRRHREATKEEIAAYEQEMATKREAAMGEEAARASKTTRVSIDPSALAHAIARLKPEVH